MTKIRGLFFLLCFYPLTHIHADGLRAGAAAVDISPVKLPAIVNGGFLQRKVSTIADRLHARSIVLNDGKERIAICIVDSCMVPRDLCDAAKVLAEKQTGISTEHILIASTHTHSAPSAMRALGTPADPDYIQWLPGKIAESIVLAQQKLAPATLGMGAVALPDLVACRRWIYQPANMLSDPFGEKTVRANMHPGHQNPKAMGPSGPEDPDLTVLSIRHADGRPLALLGNYGMHYFSGARGISADYFGVFAKYIAEELGADEDFVGILSNGTSGDMWRRDYEQPKPEKDITITEYARKMAQEAAKLAGNITYRDRLKLGMKETLLPLKRRTPDAKRLAWADQMIAAMGDREIPKSRPEVYAKEAHWLHENPNAELKLQVIRLGDHWINGIPNETYALTGLKLKSFANNTMNISLANGGEGYIPPEEQYALGGYNTWPARSAALEEPAEGKIVERLIDMRVSFDEQELGWWSYSTVYEGAYRQALFQTQPDAYHALEDMAPKTTKYFTVNSHLAYEPGVVFYLPGVDNSRAPQFAGGRLQLKQPALGETYSMACWIYNGMPNEARPVTGYFFSRGKNGDEQAAGDHLGIMGTYQKDQAGRLVFFNGNEKEEVLIGKTVLAPKTWYQVTLVRKGKEVRVYLDGLPEISGHVSVTRPSAPQTFFGGRCDNFANFEGKIDEISVWERALSDVEVARMLSSVVPEPPLPFPQSPAAFIAQLPMPDGLEMQCVASEPLIEDPIAIDFAADGRLWVVEMRDYPDGMNDQRAPGGRIKILSDTDGDGVFDTAEIFRDDLAFPTGVKAWGDGAIYCDAEGVHLPDGSTMTGFGNNTLHTRVNGPWWTLDNRLMFANGRNSTQIKWRGEAFDIFRRDFSISHQFGDLRTEGGQSQYGRTRDDWDNWFGVDYQTLLYHFPLPDHYLRRNPSIASPRSSVYVPAGPRRTPVRPRGEGPLRSPHATEAHRTTSHSGPCINRSTRLGEKYLGDAFVCEPSHTVVLRRSLKTTGSTFVAHDPDPAARAEWLASEDNWFRPTQIRSGPDGALWLVDMYRMIIEHTKWLPEAQKKVMNVRAGDASGRIYRIYPKGQAPSLWPNLAQRSNTKVAELMESPHGTLRDLVQQELVQRNASDAEATLRGRCTYSKRPEVRAQALWTLSALGKVNFNDLARAIKDPDPRVSAQGARVSEKHPLPGVIDVLLERVATETDPTCVQQIACSLGVFNQDPRVVPALESIGERFADNHFIKAAALSSMPSAHPTDFSIEWKVEARTASNTKRAAMVRDALDDWPEQGRAATGKTIYDAQCLICHAVGENGNAIGPDLTALSNRSPAFLVESILDPQRAIDPDYVALTLETRSGKKLTGVMKDATGSTFRLSTADGKRHEIQRTEVKRITNLNRSLMPETFDKTIPTKQLLRDLVAYLQELK